MYLIYDIVCGDCLNIYDGDIRTFDKSFKTGTAYYNSESFGYIEVPEDCVENINTNGLDNYKVIDGEVVYEKPAAEIIPDPEEPPTEEDNVVVGESALEYMITMKCEEINNTCHAAIIAGIDVETSYGLEHFSLTKDDQSNIQQWYAIAKTTDVNLPYHADDGDCKPYTNTDIIKIGSMATAHITHHTTYCNQLKKYVKSLTSVKDVFDVEYGVTQLTGEFLEKYETCMGLLAVLN